jgi:hypothetical protein
VNLGVPNIQTSCIRVRTGREDAEKRWKERDTRAAMLFGRAFEVALRVFSERRSWERVFSRVVPLQIAEPTFFQDDCWDRMLELVIMLLIRRFSVRHHLRNI